MFDLCQQLLTSSYHRSYLPMLQPLHPFIFPSHNSVPLLLQSIRPKRVVKSQFQINSIHITLLNDTQHVVMSQMNGCLENLFIDEIHHCSATCFCRLVAAVRCRTGDGSVRVDPPQIKARGVFCNG